MIERIRQEMLKLGFDEVTVDPMGNLLGRIGSGPRVIALDGHVDTVDVGELSLWDRDPFSGDIEDGILYGRGASDMKGGVASSVYAGALLKKSGIPDNVTLYVTATVQEEDCDGLCWQYIVNEDGLRPDLVVITEPTSLRIYRGTPRTDGNGSPHLRYLLPRISTGARGQRGLQDGRHHR